MTVTFKEEKLSLPGPSGALEAVLTRPKKEQLTAVGLVCHLHPLYDGTMNNKVVTTVVRAWNNLGMAALRFNYRGVGASEGEYGHGEGETQDTLTMLDWLIGEFPGCRVCLAGFSFGAYVAAQVTAQRSEIAQLLTLAPPVNHADFEQFSGMSRPWMVIQGDQDEIVPFDEVVAWHAKMAPQPDLVVFPGVSHFFHGHLVQLRETIERFCGDKQRTVGD